MPRLFRSLLPVLAAVFLLGASAGRPLAAEQPPAWPQAASDLAPDPAVRFGVLPNGLRYAVMRNATPAGQTALRLRIGSGSLEEDDSQQGLAHVLEHMAFKGSTRVSAGEMVRTLQRLGLAFGPDTNAQTGWTQTVYMLDLPRSDAVSLSTGLMLLRETASELTLDPTALAGERGVVLSEERLRDTPRYRAQKAQVELALAGQRAAVRFPIGQVEVIRNAPAGVVRAFYAANYRPDRATMIAVGDFDPAKMEADIRHAFADWRPVGAEVAPPALGPILPRGLTTEVKVIPGASTTVVLAWAQPYDSAADTAAKEVSEAVENLGLSVLNRRLGRLAQSPSPPFLAAGAAYENLLDSAKIATVQAAAAPGAWRPALDAVELEVRRLLGQGVDRAELDREIVDTRARLSAAVAGAATRPTPELANALVETVDTNQVFTPPASDLAIFERAVAGLKTTDVDAAVRRIFAGQGPLVQLVTPDPIPGGDGALAQAFAEARARLLGAASAQATVAWPYETFGPPGRVVERRAVDDLGLVTVRFANGVGLTIKPTHLRDDQVLVAANFGRGRSGLPADRPLSLWTAGAVVQGGFGKLSLEDSQKALAGKVYGASLAVGDDAFTLLGETRPADLPTQLQVLTAYLSDPGFRPEALERLRRAYQSQLPQLAATPQGVFARESGTLLTSGDTRWAFPTAADLAAATPADARALFAAPLAHGPLEATIVGDIDPDRAIALAAATLGALPPREPLAPRTAGAPVRFPAATPAPVLRVDTGRPDQALAVAGWPMPDFFADMAASRVLMLTGEVVQNRLIDQLRIAEGATYSPQTRVDLSQTFPGFGYALALVEIPPPKIEGFFASVEAIAADLAAKGPTPDELERARAPRIAGLKKAQRTNEYWLADLSGSLAEPRKLDLIRSTFPDYEKVTAADIRKAASDYLAGRKPWKLEISAEPAPGAHAR